MIDTVYMIYMNIYDYWHFNLSIQSYQISLWKPDNIKKEENSEIKSKDVIMSVTHRISPTNEYKFNLVAYLKEAWQRIQYDRFPCRFSP